MERFFFHRREDTFSILLEVRSPNHFILTIYFKDKCKTILVFYTSQILWLKWMKFCEESYLGQESSFARPIKALTIVREAKDRSFNFWTKVIKHSSTERQCFFLFSIHLWWELSNRIICILCKLFATVFHICMQLNDLELRYVLLISVVRFSIFSNSQQITNSLQQKQITQLF